MRNHRNHRAVAVGAGAANGNSRDTFHQHYVPTGSKRPKPDETYTMPDGTEHRWDGKCHENCENLR